MADTYYDEFANIGTTKCNHNYRYNLPNNGYWNQLQNLYLEYLIDQCDTFVSTSTDIQFKIFNIWLERMNTSIISLNKGIEVLKKYEHKFNVKVIGLYPQILPQLPETITKTITRRN